MPASISDRLKALGVKVGAQDLKPAPPVRSNNLENILEGHSLETPLGETFVVEQRYPLGHPHGNAALQITASPGTAGGLGRRCAPRASSRPRRWRSWTPRPPVWQAAPAPTPL